jgi:hypothetical protein
MDDDSGRDQTDRGNCCPGASSLLRTRDYDRQLHASVACAREHGARDDAGLLRDLHRGHGQLELQACEQRVKEHLRPAVCQRRDGTYEARATYSRSEKR